jgi:hypothetical protein
MPVRTPRGRAAAYRAVWQWPLRSPARLALTTAAIFALGAGITLGIGALRGGPSLADPQAGPDAVDTRAPAASPTAGAAASAPTALPPVAELEPPTLPLSQAPPEALRVAARWSAAWLRPPAGTTTEEWLEGLRPYTTEEYLPTLAEVAPENIPATDVTGEPQPVQVRPRSVQVEVPTDAVTLLLLVVDTESGWRVAGHDRA